MNHMLYIKRTITKKDLENLLSAINQRAGFAGKKTWSDTRPLIATVGMYNISEAYGGHSLERIVTESGGVKSIFNGFYSKRELFGLMSAFLNGMEVGDKIQQATA